MKLILFTAALLLAFPGYSQKKDPVLLEVGGDEITKSEFEYVYKKNNNNTVIDQKSLEEYLDLYINFRLKVKEAEELGYDTTKAFIQEFSGYKKQLSQPYLVDKEVNEQLLQEAYDRMQKDVRASHILIKVGQNALPKDTLKAYNKIIDIRGQIVKEGKDFAEMAKKHSEDPSVKDNAGDLGYFSALRMVYPFENAAYNTPVGKVSQPIRTRFGYHLVKVTDKRDAVGEVLVSHIMVKTGKEATEEDIQQAKKKIDEIYEQLQNGGEFEELAKKHSDDKTSARKGGQLPWFGTGRMVPEFEQAAFALEDSGDISKPIQTAYGWHIIKKLDEKGVPEFEEVKAELKTKIARDSRSERSKKSIIKRIKKEYGFKEKLKNRDAFYAVVDSTVFNGKWDKSKAKGLNSWLFKLDGKEYTQQQFANYIHSHQARRNPIPVEIYVNNMYDQWVNEELLKYEESKLPEKYTEYKMLLQEYRDGILLFNLTDDKVWSKAVKDTSGLKAYYEAHKSDFMWPERLDATIYIADNKEVADKVRAMLKVQIKSGEVESEDIMDAINEDSQLNLKVEKGKYIKRENEMLEKVDWSEGISPNIQYDEQVLVVHKKGIIPPQPKTLKEARGLVTQAYQAHLEEEWINSLKDKYEVVVHKEVLKTID